MAYNGNCTSNRMSWAVCQQASTSIMFSCNGSVWINQLKHPAKTAGAGMERGILATAITWPACLSLPPEPLERRSKRYWAWCTFRNFLNHHNMINSTGPYWHHSLSWMAAEQYQFLMELNLYSWNCSIWFASVLPSWLLCWSISSWSYRSIGTVILFWRLTLNKNDHLLQPTTPIILPSTSL